MPDKSTYPAAPTTGDRDKWIRASLAQRSGDLEDSLGDTGHAPDTIDAEGIGHCRVTTPDTWAPEHRQGH